MENLTFINTVANVLIITKIVLIDIFQRNGHRRRKLGAFKTPK